MKIFSKFIQDVKSYYEGQKHGVMPFVFINIFLSVLCLVYILARFKYINSLIPFWMGRNWGDFQLAPKTHLYYLPLLCGFLTLIAALFRYLNRFYIRYFDGVISYFITGVNLVILYSAYNIIQSASLPFPAFIPAKYLALFLPFIVSFVLIYLILPYFIDYAHRKRLVTDPSVHSHPAMLVREPTARGGGFVYAVAFLITCIIFLGISKQLYGIYLSVFMLALLGILDDFQNTHPTSEFRILETPALRLGILFLCVLPLVFSGVVVNEISIPFDGLVNLADFKIVIGSTGISALSAALTVVWVVWLMNALSWSNGIDGQFAGIIGISSIFIAVLALRFSELEDIHKTVAVMAAISAGAAFAFTRFTWHPSKIMWGFGAMSAGLVIASLSILAQTKVLASTLFILIPILDALVTFMRRIFQGKNPLSGDRGHLHHLLLDRGWEVKKIARFYWFTTFLFGLIGLLSPEKYSVKIALSLIASVGFIIVLLNLRLSKRKV